MSLHGNRGQLQAGNPAFGAGFQAAMSSAERFRPITWLRNPAASEEVKRKSAARSSVNWSRTRNRARGRLRILTGGDDQVHLWRQMLEQEGKGIVNRFGINNVVIVKDEDKIVRDGGDFIEQSRQNRFGWRRLRGLEHAQHAFSNIRRNRLQSSNEVSQKTCGVIIPFVQRQPGYRSPATSDPFADQRGFTKAGGGRDEGQFTVQPLVQPLDQAGAEDNFCRAAEYIV